MVYLKMNKTIPVNNMREILKKTLEVLREGGLILYPTDTIWGIGCDATNPEAVEKVFRLKGRSGDKSLIILLDNPGRLSSYLQEVPDVAYDLIDYSEKPLTIVYNGARNLAPNVIAEDGSIGIRVVRHNFCEQLLQRFRKPIVSTSANLSGQVSPRNFKEIDPRIHTGVQYVVPLEQQMSGKAVASTIVKLGPSGQYHLIRP